MRKFLFRPEFLLLSLIACLSFVSLIAAFRLAHSSAFAWVWLATLLASFGLVIRRIKVSKSHNVEAAFIIGWVIMFALLVRLIPILLETQRLHIDAALTAYFSDTLEFNQTSFYAGVPHEKGEWVSQFPSIFFWWQQGWFRLFGMNMYSVKISILPYVALSVLGLVLFVKRAIGFGAAIFSGLLFATFAPALYIDTMGLSFSSSLTLTIWLWWAIGEYLHKPNWRSAFLSGVLAGLGLLFYIASYANITLALLLIGYYQLKKRHWRSALVDLSWIIAGFGITCGPFIVSAFHHDNFFRQRTDQISFFTGTWFTQAGTEINFSEQLLPLWHQFLITIKAIYLPGIGGQGGYDFGHTALLDPFTLTLLLSSFSAVLLICLKNKRHRLVLSLIIATGLLGMAAMLLSLPVAAFHRAGLLLLTMVTIMGWGFGILWEMVRIRWLRVVLTFGLFGIFVSANFQVYRRMVAPEIVSQDVEAINWLRHKVNPEEVTLAVAAFPGYSLEKVAYVVAHGFFKEIKTEYHATLLDQPVTTDPTVFILIFPEAFEELFKTKYPQAQVHQINSVYTVFLHNILGQKR